MDIHVLVQACGQTWDFVNSDWAIGFIRMATRESSGATFLALTDFLSHTNPEAHKMAVDAIETCRGVGPY